MRSTNDALPLPEDAHEQTHAPPMLRSASTAFVERPADVVEPTSLELLLRIEDCVHQILAVTTQSNDALSSALDVASPGQGSVSMTPPAR